MPYTVKKEKGGFKACKKVKKESFDEMINQYLNHYLFEDLSTPSTPSDPKKVQQATNNAKQSLIKKANLVKPSEVAKAMEAAEKAGLDPSKLTS